MRELTVAEIAVVSGGADSASISYYDGGATIDMDPGSVESVTVTAVSQSSSGWTIALEGVGLIAIGIGAAAILPELAVGGAAAIGISAGAQVLIQGGTILTGMGISMVPTGTPPPGISGPSLPRRGQNP